MKCLCHDSVLMGLRLPSAHMIDRQGSRQQSGQQVSSTCSPITPRSRVSVWYVALLCCCCARQVKAAASEAGTATFRLVGNRDIEHILDDLLHCVARPAEVPAVVSKLSATTFVQVGGG